MGLPVIQQAPIVTMRLAEVKGRKSADLLKDPHRKAPEWELEREYRSTYRDDRERDAKRSPPENGSGTSIINRVTRRRSRSTRTSRKISA